jgi:hypothetical protein
MQVEKSLSNFVGFFWERLKVLREKKAVVVVLFLINSCVSVNTQLQFCFKLEAIGNDSRELTAAWETMWVQWNNLKN